ncbi:YbjN domain-containing protein [Zavarzinia sp. CC-PAN008]|uniref:YbjN domain-containing protein n=1 Tax=Zavarzinia sp. CC-PAN008 TaxID=3243332 RepID=UPI003F744E67
MASLSLRPETPSAANPLEMIEQIVAAHDWPYDRSSEEDLSVCVAGTWCEYQLNFSWRDDHQALQLSCALDTKVAEPRRNDIYGLLGLINEQLWLGHFCLWAQEGVLMFRYGLLSGMDGIGPEQCEEMIDVAISECERFYTAFQFVLWGGKNPKDALAAALFETVGEA